MKPIRMIQAGFLAAILCSSALQAGPYVKIQKIDAASSYPRIKVFMSINGILAEPGPGFDGKNLILFEDGNRVDGPVAVARQADGERYLYLVFSLDTSKSISKKFMAGIRSAALAIIKNLGRNDKVSIYSFGDQVTELNRFTADFELLKKEILSVERSGRKTLLYESIISSIKAFDSVKTDDKKILIFTDGKDEGSGVTEEEVVQAARNADTPLYFICFQPGSRLRAMGRIAKRTGGRLIYGKRPEAVSDMYRTIISERKNRFAAEYTTNLKRDGMTHRIDVQLIHNDIRDKDSGFVRIDPAPIASAPALSKELIYIAAGVLLILLSVGAVVIIFLIREKRILKERINAEQKLLETRGLFGPAAAFGYADGPPYEEPGPGDDHSNAWMFQKSGPNAGKKYLIQRPEFTIGSGAENDIVIRDANISQRHIKLRKINGIYHIFDLMSERGTFLNGKKLLRPKAVHDWDEIAIGRTVLIFRGSSQQG